MRQAVQFVAKLTVLALAGGVFVLVCWNWYTWFPRTNYDPGVEQMRRQQAARESEQHRLDARKAELRRALVRAAEDRALVNEILSGR